MTTDHAPDPDPRKRSPKRSFSKTISRARNIHPALIPGITVEDTKAKFPTNKGVLVVALIVTLAVLAWAIIAPDNLAETGTNLQSWVVVNFGWLFTSIMLACLIFLLAIAILPTGKIRLGADDSAPDFSRASWISMLFAAGLGIALIFYGPMEPLTHFLTPPPYETVEAATQDAVVPAIVQGMLHQATLPWTVYALVGGSLAYAAYRRGRLPLISSLFEPVVTNANNRIAGKIIDVFAVLVTLFGTATSLGIGALQIRTGTSIVTGRPLEGNGIIVVIISVLTVLFIISAMTGIQKGIRMMSNLNLGLVIGLAGFVLITGPTLYLLDLVPASIMQFFDRFIDMMSIAPSQGPAEEEFALAWTILFWAWWISWSPFVGMFIAKISRGRTIREYVAVILLVPTSLTTVWFVIFGGTAAKSELDGNPIPIEGSGENVMFDLLGYLPLSGFTNIVVLIAIVIFFNTAADSATNVMGSMSQSGRPVPSTPMVIIWGSALGAISLFLLLAGGEDTLSGLQSIMVSASLPFTIILIGIMYCWAKDLARDPVILRQNFATAAIDQGVRRGLDEHNGNFIFGADPVPQSQGAGAEFEKDDPNLSEWYTEVASEEYLSEQAKERDKQEKERETFKESLDADGHAQPVSEADESAPPEQTDTPEKN